MDTAAKVADDKNSPVHTGMDIGEEGVDRVAYTRSQCNMPY
jgi:hypothetical protein